MKNLSNANVTHVANSGVYCFEGLSFTPKNAIVSGGNGDGLSPDDARQRADRRPSGDPPSCPVAATVRVITIDSNTPGAGTDRRFSILFQN